MHAKRQPNCLSNGSHSYRQPKKAFQVPSGDVCWGALWANCIWPCKSTSFSQGEGSLSPTRLTSAHLGCPTVRVWLTATSPRRTLPFRNAVYQALCQTLQGMYDCAHQRSTSLKQLTQVTKEMRIIPLDPWLSRDLNPGPDSYAHVLNHYIPCHLVSWTWLWGWHWHTRLDGLLSSPWPAKRSAHLL